MTASECSLFAFPVHPQLRKQWIAFCRQSKEFVFKNSCICMEHFAKEDFENTMQFEMGFAKRMLKRSAVPSIYKPHDDPERSQRVQRREDRKIVLELLRTNDDAASQEGKCLDNEIEFISVEEIDNIREETDPRQAFVGNENSALAANRISTASILRSSLAMDEMKDLQAKVETLEKENASLRIENTKLRSEVFALKRTQWWKEKKNTNNMDAMNQHARRVEKACKNMEDKLEGIFTKGQIEKLKNNVKRPSWTDKDIAQSITLYAAGAKSYKLMYKKGFPLPGVRTLQAWSQKIDVSRGMLQPVFKLMAACTHMSERQKLSVLCFDEMKIRKTYCYDASTDSTLAPVSYVQVLMLRGLVSNWKQPVYYD